MSLPLETEAYPTTATRRTFANVSFGYVDEELEVSTRDPQEVMRKLPEYSLRFYFYDRLVADVGLGEETIQITSDQIDPSDEQYFVDVKRVYERSQTFGWWRTDFYRIMRKEMDKHKTNHVVIWDRLWCGIIAYRPGVDVLLYR